MLDYDCNERGGGGKFLYKLYQYDIIIPVTLTHDQML